MTLLAPDWSRTIRAKVGLPAFRAALEALDARVESYHDFLPPVPEQQAGYYHDFFCPDHAVQLRFDPGSPHCHTCPVDGAEFRGEPFDSAWFWSVNDMRSDAALKLSFRSYLEAGQSEAGRTRDRTLAAGILDGYAQRYLEMKPAPTQYDPHPGVVTWQGLDESVWIIRMVWAYALLEESLPQSAREELARKLFRPAAEHLHRVRWPEIHNVTNWNNAALATLAVVLEDEDLLKLALGGSLGLRAQLQQGVSEDGIWWEGSLSYHYYILDAVVWTMRILRATDRSFDDGGILKRMFLTPILISLPDLKLPSLNDCWHFIGLLDRVGHGIPEAEGFYETAFAWFRDPAFAWVLQQNYRNRPRTCFEALLEGVEELPSGEPPPSRSRHLADLGCAILRSPGALERQRYLFLKAGPGGGEHGHLDQLRIQFFAGGASIIPDLGTSGYGIGLNQTWYRHTASHSTVLLDGQPQPLTDGRFNHFLVEDSFTLADASVSWSEGVYQGVRMRRVILWRDCYFIDLFQVIGPCPRDIDWICHLRGRLMANPFESDFDRRLKPERVSAHTQVEGSCEESKLPFLRWRCEGGSLDLNLLGPEGQIFLGTSPSNRASERLSTIIRRRSASETTFLSVFSFTPKGEDPSLQRVEGGRREDGIWRLILETSSGSDEWTMGVDPGDVRLQASTASDR